MSKAQEKKNTSAKTKTGIGSLLHLNSAFQLAFSVNPQLFAISCSCSKKN